MPADASIYGMIQKPQQQGPLEQYAQMLQVKGLMDSGEANALQRRKLESDLAEEEAFKAAFRTAPGGKVNVADLMSASPTRGLAYQKNELDRQKTQAELDKSQVERFASASKAMRDVVAGIRSDADMPLVKETAMRLFGPEIAAKMNIPDRFDPAWQQQTVMTGDKFLDRLKSDVRPIDTGSQTVFREMNPNAPGFSNAPIQNTARPQGPTWDSERGVHVQPPSAQPGGAPSAPANLPPRSGDVAAIRKEFNDLPEVKNYRSVVPIYNSAVNAPDSRSGDIQFAYTIGKIFDPNSVVREGELKLVGDAATWLQKYEGELRTFLEGKGRLSPQTRKELLEVANTRISELDAAQKAARTTYETQAKAKGLPTDQIFIEMPKLAVPKKADKPGKPGANRPSLGDIFGS